MKPKYNLKTMDDVYLGKGETVIEALKNARVISITENNGIITIGELCDKYFETYLTKKELNDFAMELLNIAKEK